MATTVSRAKQAASRGTKKTPARTTAKKATPRTPAKKAVAKKAIAKKAIAKQAIAKQAVAKKAIAKTPVAKKPAVKKVAASKIAPKRGVAKQAAPAKSPSAGSARKSRPATHITPKKALANTRRLLEAKQAHDREAPPWQALEARHGTAPHAGFQDGQARDQANELHAGESRMEAIQGAIGTQDRHNQGKRDQR